MGRKRNDRPLKPQEAALWRSVTDTVTPLAQQPVPLVDPTPEPPLPLPAPRASTASLRTITPAPPPSLAKDTVLDAGDPRAVRRIAKGRTSIEATLDLHGLTQDEAQERLRRFIEFARLRDQRTVLVITGYGRSGRRHEGRARGILRRRFLEWIDTPPLSDLVSAVHPARRHHGGEGAFYVLLRKRQAPLRPPVIKP